MPVRYVQPYELKRDGALLALVTLPVSWAANRALWNAGFHSLPGRWMLGVIVIYATYLGLLRVWSAGMGEVRLLGRGEGSPTPAIPAASYPGTRFLDLPFDLAFEWGDGLLSGLFYGIAALSVIGLLWWFGGLAWLAAETALEWLASAALAASLVRRTSEPWTLALLRRTWPPVALALLAALIAGTMIQQVCPSASTLGQILHAEPCVM